MQINIKNVVYKFLFAGMIFVVPLIMNAQNSITEPIVIVPGILGSWNVDVVLADAQDNGLLWIFHPYDHTWDKMIPALIDKGYEWNKTLFVAFYDWRKSNEISAKNYLVPTIDKALQNSSSTKINIIAYSMGGLVARSYIQSEDYVNRNDVDQLIMLGTPNYGSSDVYTLWEGGRVPRNWDIGTRAFLNGIIDINNVQDFTTDDEYDTVHKYFSSVGELLPTYDFLVDSQGNAKPYYDLTEAQNSFLGNLNTTNISNLLELGHITVIAGTGTSTVGNISVVDRPVSETKLWSDGIPEPLTPVRNDTNGDNRVLVDSVFIDDIIFSSQPALNFWGRLYAGLFPIAYAQFNGELDGFLDQIEINSNHGGLPTVAIPEVFAALGLSNPVEDFEPPAEPNNITTFWFASPVAVKVTDPQGRVITKDSNNIPGAVYTGETDPNGVKMIIIPDGLSGEYEVELTGTGDGQYHMGISSFTDTNDSTVTAQKSVVMGEVIKYTTNINNETGVVEEVSEPIITLPNDEDPPVEKSAIELTQELINNFKRYYEEGEITNKGVYQSLSNNLKIVLASLKEADLTRPIGEKYPKLHDLKVKIAIKLAINKLESFVDGIERANKKGQIKEAPANSLINQAEAVISKID